MKNLFIVGAGGFGREMFHWARQHPDHGRLWRIAGFLDDKISALEGYHYVPGVLGTIRDYNPMPTDLLLIAIALPKIKKTVVESLIQRGADFLTYIHPSVVVGGNVSVGRGTVVCPGAVITSDVTLGEFVTFNCCSSIGHDARLGDFVTLSGHCDITGFCRVEEGAFFGSHACMIPRTRVGAWATVGAGSTVIMSVPDGVTVIGSPARRLVA
jgi:sugar O-acyltransferase (sialic acid O-acetyltransferase NeuD family)